MNGKPTRSLSLELTESARGDWSFVGEPWGQGADGLINTAGDAVDENLAFYTAQAFGDFEAEYEFRWDCVWTSGAFVFRAQNARHYYVLDFPAVGQQYRAEHFWAMLSTVDDSGFRKVLAMPLVPGVTSAIGVWHHVQVQVHGEQIDIKIDKRPVISIRDATYTQPGYVGLNTYNAIGGDGEKSTFRNVRINGAPVSAPAFADQPAPVFAWQSAHPDPSQGCGRIVRTDNGDLLVSSGENRLLRSADNGATWVADDPLPEEVQIGLPYTTVEGQLAMVRTSHPGLPAQILKSTSQDQGRTWSPYRQVGDVTLPDSYPYENFSAGSMIQTRDGRLVLMGNSSGNYKDIRKAGRCVIHHDALGSFCVCSDDGGETWSEAVDIDGPPHDERYWLFMKCGCEISGTELADGTLLTINRPIWSPFVWESRSSDGGHTWTPMTRGPFSLYAACSAMVTTTSGAVVIGGRFPALAVQVSRDNGYTWQCHQTDTAAWANGSMLEVEPDVVLYVYGGRQELRYQRLRVTPDGLEPVG